LFDRLWRRPLFRVLLCAALALAAGDVMVRGVVDGTDYLNDGRWGWGAFVFGPFIFGVCSFVALYDLLGRPTSPPPRALWVLIAAGYVVLGVAFAVV
jgi:drug/metabolite transporter (DMT)-like permease